MVRFYTANARCDVSRLSKEEHPVIDTVWFLFFLLTYIGPVIFPYTHYVITAALLVGTWYRNNWHISVERGMAPILYWYTAVTAWVFLSLIWSPYRTNGQKTVLIGTIETAVMIVCLLDYIRSRTEIIRIMELYICATAVFAFLYYALSPIGTWGTTKMGVWSTIWRNSAGYYFIFAALFAFFLALYDKAHLTSSLAAGGLLAIAGIGTGSRKAVAQFLLAVGLYSLFQVDRRKRIRAVCVIVLGSVLIYFGSFFIPYLNALMEKYVFNILRGVDATDASTTFRAYMRQFAIELFRKHPIIGYGVEGYKEWVRTSHADALRRYAMQATYSHCNYTEMLANFGLIGFFVYYAYPVSILLRPIHKYRSFAQVCGIVTTALFLILDYGAISYYMKLYICIAVIGMSAILWDELHPSPLHTSIEFE